MLLRYVLGKTLTGTFTRPVAAGELTDPDVGVSISDVAAGSPGNVHYTLSVAVADYDPSIHSKLIAVHAVAFAKGDGIPTDPVKVLASQGATGSLDTSAATGPIDSTFVVSEVPEGPVVIQTVYAFDDAPAPSPSTAVTPASDPAATVTADPATATPAS
jgi:hypothetical protein